MLPPEVLRQIEVAWSLLADEAGHGEVALTMSNGELSSVERRPRIRMQIPRTAKHQPPPKPMAIAGHAS